MTMPSPNDAERLTLLNRHSGLNGHVQALAAIVADSDGDPACADEAGRCVIDEVRRLGQITHVWEQAAAAPEVRRSGTKKLRLHNAFGTNRSRGAADLRQAPGASTWSSASDNRPPTPSSSTRLGRHRLKISIGIGSFPDHADDIGGLIALADLTLYRAKERGRSRVEGQ